MPMERRATTAYIVESTFLSLATAYVTSFVMLRRISLREDRECAETAVIDSSDVG